MGCLWPKPGDESAQQEEAPKVYSWERNDRPDPKDFTIENLKGETVGRVPGTINGQQFILNNCEDCNIYIYDHTATVTVDDCVNCRIFIGPIKGSVYFRDCNNCKCVVACQQFRTRDCKKMDIFLCCQTQPIIESSINMKFACFQYYYPELKDHFKKSDLSVYNNNWSSIHDFTPVPGEQNWSLLPSDAKLEEHVPIPTTEQFANVGISTDVDKSTVPLTLGSRRKASDESCLVAFFNAGSETEDKVRQFIEKMREEGTCTLVQSKEIPMKPDEATRIFGSDPKYSAAASSGDVIGLEYNGDQVIQKCSSIIQPVIGDSTFYISDNTRSSAQEDIDGFYNFADMQMAM
ncbi:protein XRP2-like [Saccoglossus kowalevskii]|uniref:Protein XRP2 n=1 Tax=Saccoglossus kowalevskii TaxID=10224 RepID=A0ABM0H0G8_SACKO|nr:PREDICTED: protein XRP2-like [Saccoglossus kowalevskii]